MPPQYPFGKPYPRVLDPKQSGLANPQGLYRWSAFYAPLATYSGTTVAADSTLAGDSVTLLLFTNDIPVICRAVVYDATTQQTNTQASVNFRTLPAAFVAATAGGTAAVTVTNYGEVMKGYAGAALAVPVSGFAAAISGSVVAPLGTTVTAGVVQAGVASSVAIECIANGAVASGIISPNFTSAGTFGSALAPTPIILQNSAYTQAIKDNDNLIVSSTGLLYQVVGLYYNT
jgi:hypothetical protein